MRLRRGLAVLACAGGLILCGVLAWNAWINNRIATDARLWQGDFLIFKRGQWFKRTEQLGQGALGCQKPEILTPVQLRPSTKRIVLIGSSLAFGSPFRPELAPPPQTAWQLVEASWASLEASKKAPPMDFINLSFPGSQSLNLACLVRSATKLKPDLVLFQPTNNETVGIGARAWQSCLGIAPIGLGNTLDLLRGRQHREDWCFYLPPGRGLKGALNAARAAVGKDKLAVIYPPAFEAWPTALPLKRLPRKKLLELALFWRKPEKANTSVRSWIDSLSKEAQGPEKHSLQAYAQAMSAFIKGDMDESRFQLGLSRDRYPGNLCISSGAELRTLKEDAAEVPGRILLDLSMQSEGSLAGGEKMADSCHPNYAGQVAMAKVYLVFLARRYGVNHKDLLHALSKAIPEGKIRSHIEDRGALTSLAFTAHKGNLNLSTFQYLSKLTHSLPESALTEALNARNAATLRNGGIYKKAPSSLKEAMIRLYVAFPKRESLSMPGFHEKARAALDAFVQSAFPNPKVSFSLNAGTENAPLSLFPMPAPWRMIKAVCQEGRLVLEIAHPNGKVAAQIKKGKRGFLQKGGYQLTYSLDNHLLSEAHAKNGMRALAGALESASGKAWLHQCTF